VPRPNASVPTASPNNCGDSASSRTSHSVREFPRLAAVDKPALRSGRLQANVTALRPTIVGRMTMRSDAVSAKARGPSPGLLGSSGTLFATPCSPACFSPDYSSTRGIGFQPVIQARQARCLSHFSRS
jgi:hypothetical protein